MGGRRNCGGWRLRTYKLADRYLAAGASGLLPDQNKWVNQIWGYTVGPVLPPKLAPSSLDPTHTPKLLAAGPDLLRTYEILLQSSSVSGAEVAMTGSSIPSHRPGQHTEVNSENGPDGKDFGMIVHFVVYCRNNVLHDSAVRYELIVVHILMMHTRTFRTFWSETLL